MWIACWNCGQDVWLETQKTCRHCDAPTHRCVDCLNYDAKGSSCRVLKINLNAEESKAPTLLTISSNCASYRITDEAKLRRSDEVQDQKTTAQPKAAPAPAQSSAAAPPTSAEPVEYITIRREPPMKRPKHPVVIAHRGDSANLPENTLAAFKAAIAAGAHAIEFDVHLTSDGVPIVIHDAIVDRCTDGHGEVATLTLEQIKALDVGSWFGDQYTGERIPTLDEAIAAIPGPTALFIHLRAHSNENDAAERAVVEAVERTDCRKRAVVTHHTRHGLKRIRDIDPKLRLCWIPIGSEVGEEYVDDSYLLGCRFLQPHVRDVTQKFVDYAHVTEMWVNVFWADEVEEMQRLIALGVDGILTNYPSRLRDTIKSASVVEQLV